MEQVGVTIGGFTAAQVALLGVALQFAVLAPGWFIAARVLPSERRSVRWWGWYAAGNAAGLLMIVLGMRDHDEWVRAAGNLLVVMATMALQRGLWAFMSRAPANRVQLLVLALVGAATLAGMQPAWAPLRIGVVSLLWGGLYLWAACEVLYYVEGEMRFRLAALYALPLLATALMLIARSFRALQSPATVLAEVNQPTLLGLGSSMAGLVLALVLQLTLVGLVVARLVQRLERASRHDPLTGLLNRRALDELLNQESHRLRRLPGPLSVLMIDVDHFKRLNDSRGHATGDRALQHLAAVMAGHLREIDHLGRWGGEEFLALLPGTDGAEALVLAERLVQRVRAAPLVVDGVMLPLTASVGVAEWDGVGDSVAAMLARADAALYRGKRGGRDRAVGLDRAGTPLADTPHEAADGMGAAAPGRGADALVDPRSDPRTRMGEGGDGDSDQARAA